LKLRIKEVNKLTPFIQAGNIILLKRMKVLLRTIRNYFGDESVENLHQIRIALRRLRYILEVFYLCVDKKTFNSFYNKLEYLQDLTGELRDIDVLKENALNLYEGKLSSEFLNELEFKRHELNETLRLELMKFIHNKEIKEFKNQLK
jgi:CHAD domain-containing protein